MNFLAEQPKKYADLLNCENCIGDHLRNSKDCEECFIVHELEYSKYFHNGDVGKHCYDCNTTGQAQWCHNSVVADCSYMVGFSLFCRDSKFCLYCDSCDHCDNCFGCVSLKHKKNCILNKEYSEKEYRELKEKIIEQMKASGEWGRFFAPSLCPHGYNETLAMEWHPLNEKEAKALWYDWQEKLPGFSGKETVSIEKLPDDIKDFHPNDKDIIEDIYACKRCQRNFRYIPQELTFYMKQKVPLPILCPHCRHEDRIRLINPAKIRKCPCDGFEGKCENTCYTTHPVGTKIFCESCYQKYII